MLLMLATAATALASGLLLKCAVACRRKSSTSYSKSTNDLRGLESRERGEEEEEETTSEEEMARGHRQDQSHVVFLTVVAHFLSSGFPDPYPRPTYLVPSLSRGPFLPRVAGYAWIRGTIPQPVAEAYLQNFFKGAVS
jgi:hypothetical protein